MTGEDWEVTVLKLDTHCKAAWREELHQSPHLMAPTRAATHCIVSQYIYDGEDFGHPYNTQHYFAL